MNDYIVLRSQLPTSTIRETGSPRLSRELSNRAVFYDGIGVFGGTLYLSGSEPQGRERGRGCFMLARQDTAGDIMISSNPLAMYSMFVYHKDGVFLIANRTRLLIDALRAVGRSVQKSLKLFGMFFALGSMLYDGTGYQDVRLLSVGETVKIRRDGTVAIERKSLANLFYPDASYDELLEETAAEVTENVRAVAAGFFSAFSCDLTADSDYLQRP